MPPGMKGILCIKFDLFTIKKHGFLGCLWPDKRHPGHRSRYGKYGPRSGYGFLRTACQPIRIENFEKPYNKYVCRFGSVEDLWHRITKGFLGFLAKSCQWSNEKTKLSRSEIYGIHRRRRPSEISDFAPDSVATNITTSKYITSYLVIRRWLGNSIELYNTGCQYRASLHVPCMCLKLYVFTHSSSKSDNKFQCKLFEFTR